MKAETILLFVASAALASAQSGNALTAREVVRLIQQHVGVPWRSDTVDTFKAGDPDTPVTGIASTTMATFDVLKRASEQHLNFIITHEPTFYSHQDKTDSLEAAERSRVAGKTSVHQGASSCGVAIPRSLAYASA